MSEQKPAEAGARPTPWNYQHLLMAFIIGFILQNIVLSSLDIEGSAKFIVALIFDALYLARVAWAYWRKETGRGWIFYIVLMYTSAGWIEGSLWLHNKIVH
jgi:hypothetical protein